VPKVVQIVLFHTLSEDLDVVNRFYQQYTGTAGSLSDSGALAWATAVSASWATHLAPDLSHQLTLTKVTVTDLSSSIGGFGEFDSSNAGTSADPSLPAGTAMVIKQHIERRYRGGHPRQYLAGLTANELNDPQTWKPATVGQFQTDYTAFRAACAAGCPVGIGPAVDVNVSYFQGFTNHTYPSGRVRPIPNLRGTPVVDVISSFGVNNKVGSQRRRNLQSL
jgi:hypothetical protein